MENKNRRALIYDILLIGLGSALFAFGFSMFLRPNEINGGGVSGIVLIISELTGWQAIGVMTFLCNVPLFLLGWRQIGRRFFLGSLFGMLVSSALIDVFALLPHFRVEPLLAALYGGVLIGIGLGLVFLRGASTGGTDIVARLIKNRVRHAPIGKIMFSMDALIVVLTGFVFKDINKALYSAVALYVTSLAMDAVIYGRNDSGVATIISERYEEIVKAIELELDRGSTILSARGSYTNQPKNVILCAVKSAQVAQLQKLVTEIDPDAFVIMQKAHQVLGDGFARYSDDTL